MEDDKPTPSEPASSDASPASTSNNPTKPIILPELVDYGHLVSESAPPSKTRVMLRSVPPKKEGSPDVKP